MEPGCRNWTRSVSQQAICAHRRRRPPVGHLRAGGGYDLCLPPTARGCCGTKIVSDRLHAVSRGALLWLGSRKNAQLVISRVPLTRRVARRFVAGDRAEDATEAIRRLNAQGVDGVLNLLGEGVTTSADADAAAAEYADAIAVAAGQVRTSITLKPSQLGLLFDAAGCAARLRQVAVQAAAAGLGLEVDMEQSSHVAATIETFLSAGLDPLPRLAIQACLHRSPSDLETLIGAGVRTRLVKGAYLEGPGVAIQQTGAISRRYGELSTLLLERGADPAFATHDSTLTTTSCVRPVVWVGTRGISSFRCCTGFAATSRSSSPEPAFGCAPMFPSGRPGIRTWFGASPSGRRTCASSPAPWSANSAGAARPGLQDTHDRAARRGQRRPR